MKYDEQFFKKLQNETDNLLKFLQICKFSGSYETKLDLNTVIKLITNQSFIIDSLRKELKTIEEQLLKKQ